MLLYFMTLRPWGEEDTNTFFRKTNFGFWQVKTTSQFL